MNTDLFWMAWNNFASRKWTSSTSRSTTIWSRKWTARNSFTTMFNLMRTKRKVTKTFSLTLPGTQFVRPARSFFVSSNSSINSLNQTGSTRSTLLYLLTLNNWHCNNSLLIWNLSTKNRVSTSSKLSDKLTRTRGKMRSISKPNL